MLLQAALGIKWVTRRRTILALAEWTYRCLLVEGGQSPATLICCPRKGKGVLNVQVGYAVPLCFGKTGFAI